MASVITTGQCSSGKPCVLVFMFSHIQPPPHGSRWRKKEPNTWSASCLRCGSAMAHTYSSFINDVLLPMLTPFQCQLFTVVFTHWWKYGWVNQVGAELCVRTAVLNHSENIPSGRWSWEKHNSHMKLRLITWLIFFFLRAHVRLLYISTIKHQSSNTKPTEQSRHRSKWEILPFWKR